MDAHSSTDHKLPYIPRSIHLPPIASYKQSYQLTFSVHSSVELSIGIICSCLPYMPSLFRKSGHLASLPFFDRVRPLLAGWGLIRSSSSGDTGDVSRRAPPSTCHSQPHGSAQDSAMEMGQIHAGHSGKFANRLDHSSKTNKTSRSIESDY